MLTVRGRYPALDLPIPLLALSALFALTLSVILAVLAFPASATAATPGGPGAEGGSAGTEDRGGAETPVPPKTTESVARASLIRVEQRPLAGSANALIARLRCQGGPCRVLSAQATIRSGGRLHETPVRVQKWIGRDGNETVPVRLGRPVAGTARLRIEIGVRGSAKPIRLTLDTHVRSSLRRVVIGHSVRGRSITAWRSGDPAAPFKVLVVGSIHGDEPEGMRVVKRLRQIAPSPQDLELVTIQTTNPDGAAAHRRTNARGVDLNRNYPYRWDGNLTGGYYSGPKPASEPETRAVMSFVHRTRFDLAIWYHQPWGVTLVPCDSTRRIARSYAGLAGLSPTARCDGYSPGSAINWMHDRFKTAAFVVEFPGRRLMETEVRRHARAVMRLARSLMA